MEMVTVSQEEVTRKLIVLVDRRLRDINAGSNPGSQNGWRLATTRAWLHHGGRLWVQRSRPPPPTPGHTRFKSCRSSPHQAEVIVEADSFDQSEPSDRRFSTLDRVLVQCERNIN